MPVPCRVAPDEAFQNAAMLGIECALALRTQALELFFQGPQLANTLCHMADVGVEQGIHIRAVVARRILKRQQCADLVQAHVQAAAVAYKLQAPGVASE